MIYVDESIQDRLGYIVTAFVYAAEDPCFLVAQALTRAGLTPGREEYKSGARMTDKTNLQMLRTELFDILCERCRIGVLLSPSADRRNLGLHVVSTVLELVRANGLATPETVFVDEGITLRGCIAQEQALRFMEGCDSKVILGLQLADCAAYHCSYVLRERVQGSPKVQTYGAEDGFSEEIEVPLGWTMRTALRYAFFREEKDWDTFEDDSFLERKLVGYGAFVAGAVPDDIAQEFQREFGQVWLGCVH